MKEKRSKRSLVVIIIVVALMLLLMGTAILIVLKKKADSTGSSSHSMFSDEDATPGDGSRGDTSLDNTNADNIFSGVDVTPIEIKKNDSLKNVASENTIMIYMIGSNLESEAGAASLDLSEMIGSGVDTSKTNVVIFTGGASQWKFDVSSDKNYVVRVEGNKGYYLDGETSDIANMGEAGTLLGFLDFCTKNYKANHYSLIFWDHGSGPVYGYGVDELHKNDTMTYAELEAAMSASDFGKKKKLDFVGFDACLMASIEFADLFSDYADYMVASQEVEPGMGWNYSFLDTYNETSDPKAITSNIIDDFTSFYDQYASMMKNPMYTLSCMDLSKVKSVNAAVNDIFGDMYEGLGNSEYSSIVQARSATINCGSTAYGSKQDAIDQIDLGSVANEFGGMYAESAEKLNSAVDDFIIKQGSNISGTSGVCIYFPYDSQMFYQYYGSTAIDQISVADNYTTFVKAFATAWESDGEDVASFYTQLEESTEASTEQPTEQPTEASTEATTEVATEASTEATTEVATEASTEATTEIATEAPTEEQTEASTEAQTEAPVEETTEAPQTANEGDNYIYSESSLSVKLSKEQMLHMVSASYNIFYKNQGSQYDDAYVPVLTNVEMKPDSNGVLQVPYDPEVFVAVSGGEESIWPFKQVDVNFGEVEVYRSNGQMLISSILDFPETTYESVVCNVAVKDDHEPEIISFDSMSDSEMIGKNDVSPEGWGYMGYYAPTYLPVKDADGEMTPFTEWDRDGSFYLSYSTLNDDFHFARKHLSEMDEEFVCQIVITDVKGNEYATNIVDFTRNPRTKTTVPTPSGTIEATVYNDHAVIDSYTGGDSELEIPATILDKPVTVLGEDSFRNTELKNVTIPEGVVAIGSDAFTLTHLEQVTLPSTLKKIGEGAFSYIDELGAINLPEGLENIDNYAFYQTSNIADITVPTSVTYIGPASLPGNANVTFEGNDHYVYKDGSIFTADGKTLVECLSKEETYAIPEGTEIIGSMAFRENKYIKSVTFPEGLRMIDDGAFYGATNFVTADLTLPSTLENIGDLAFGQFVLYDKTEVDKFKIGPNVKQIGRQAFNGLKVRAFEVDEKNEYFSSKDGFLTNKNGDALILAPAVDSEELVVPDGISSVYTEDFLSLNKNQVTSLVLADSVKTLNASSLTGITKLTIGKSLKNIIDIEMLVSIEDITVSKDNRSFQEHDGVLYSYDLKELLIYPSEKTDKKFEIPEGVQTVATSVFEDNENLKEIEIPATLKDIGVSINASAGNAFTRIPNLEKITVSKKNKRFASYKGLLYNKEGTELLAVPRAKDGKIEVAKSTESIEGGAMMYLDNAEEVILPDGLKSIRTSNFYSTHAKVHIPDSVIYISSRTFVNPEGATIYGKKGSEAERIAAAKGVPFVEEK